MRSLASSALALGILVAACSTELPEPGPVTEQRALMPETWTRKDATGTRVKMWLGDAPGAGATAEAMARDFLWRNEALFQLAGIDLELEQTRQGLAGTYLRFGQRAAGLPVFEAQAIVLIDGAGHVRAANLTHRRVAPPAAAHFVGEAAARRAALAAVGPGATRVSTVLGFERDGQLAYRVRVSEPAGDWEVRVDARTGAVRERLDLRRYAEGTGLVFDPNPIASTGDTSLRDNDDATSPALDAARLRRALPRLDGSGFLRGTWVDARPKTLPQRAFSATLTFDYDRANPDGNFEEVMAYFHLDRAQARIQALGFTNVNNRVQVANVNDKKFDNSFYNPQDHELTFGTGGVDDAEDAEVILHEYGHSIQDNQVPDFGGGDEGAMGEGFGDYISASFNDVLSAEITNPNCLADWDATSYDTGTPPCLRLMNSPKHFPEFFAGEVHADGEMWSSALFRARATLGADVMDRVVIESHFLLSNDETFADAVAAVYMAEQMLTGGAHHVTLRRTFVWQGFSDELSPPAALPDVVDSSAVDIENSRTDDQYLDHTDELKSYTAPGAAALQLHFAQIGTELDPSCTLTGGACDRIFLYDASGDLYQILSGTETDVTSVQIPGDTVQIRLVSDGSVPGYGYHIDRVDVRGTKKPDAGPPDAPPPPDAVVGGPDGPVGPPDGAVATPDAPVSTPDAAVSTPDGPVSTPDAATAPPDAPAPPDADVTLPDAMSMKPDARPPDARVGGEAGLPDDGGLPQPDAMVAKIDGGAADAAGGAIDARVTDAKVSSTDAAPAGAYAEGGGCGCRTAPGRDGETAWWIGIVGVVVVLRRRRRR